MQRQEERKVAFFNSVVFGHSLHGVLLTMESQVPNLSPGRKEEGLPQPRTQASSRYPSYKRIYIYIYISLTGDVTSEIAEVDWERGWVLPTTALLGNTRQPWGPGKHNNFFNYFTSFAASGRSSQSD